MLTCIELIISYAKCNKVSVIKVRIFSDAKNFSKIQNIVANRYLQNKATIVNYTIYDKDLHLEIEDMV